MTAPIQVECPTCGQAPGHRCMDLRRAWRRLDKPHAARAERARGRAEKAEEKADAIRVPLSKAQHRMLRDALAYTDGAMPVGFNAQRVRCAKILEEKGLATTRFYGVTRIELTEAGRKRAAQAT